jgi:hypothetical protein
MVAVVIDGPLGKENIGALVFDKLPEIIEVGGIQDGMAVGLSSEDRARLEYLGGLSGFRHAHARGRATLVPRPLTIVQMEKNNFVALCGEASEGAAAAVFGVAGMSSRNDDFEFLRLRTGIRPAGSIRR